MGKTNDPPDDWDDEALPRSLNAVDDAERIGNELRRVWVEGARAFLTSRLRQPSHYQPPAAWNGTKKSGRTRKAIWPAIAAKLAAAGIHNETAVRVLFCMATSSHLPHPTGLAQPENIARCRDEFKRRDIEIARRLPIDEALFRAGVWAASQTTPDPAVATRQVLNDIGRPLSAVFRYSAAVLYGFTDVAARWRDAAYGDMAMAPQTYIRTWGGVLAADLRDKFQQPHRQEGGQ